MYQLRIKKMNVEILNIIYNFYNYVKIRKIELKLVLGGIVKHQIVLYHIIHKKCLNAAVKCILQNEMNSMNNNHLNIKWNNALQRYYKIIGKSVFYS